MSGPLGRVFLTHTVDGHFLLVKVFVCYNSDKCMNSMLEIKQHYSFFNTAFWRTEIFCHNSWPSCGILIVWLSVIGSHRVFCDLFGTL